MNAPLIIGTNGYVCSIAPDTGAEVWRTKLQSGAFSATTRSDVSVIVCEGRVFAGAHGHLFCLDLADGRILWHNELAGLGYNDVSIALEGVSIQYLKQIRHSNSGAGGGAT